jgi:hypothetical protein
MMDHKIGSREAWQAAREELLRREKEHTRMGDELARQRRELPWVRVEKEYRFQTDEDGPWRSSSTVASSSSFTTSCSGRPTGPAAQPARRAPTRSTASCRISTRAT